MKIKRILNRDVLITSFEIVILAVLARGYWNNPNYIYFAPLANTLTKVLWLPLAILPTGYFQSLGPTGCLDICILPSLSQLLLMILSPAISLLILSNLIIFSGNFIKSKFKYLSKYPSRILVLILFLIVFRLLKTEMCSKYYKAGYDSVGYRVINSDQKEKYFSDTGLIKVGVQKDYSKLFKKLGLEVVWSTIDQKIVRVRPGTEFASACKLKDYSFIHKVDPLEEFKFDKNKGPDIDTWSFIDKSFCDKGNSDTDYCKNYPLFFNRPTN